MSVPCCLISGLEGPALIGAIDTLYLDDPSSGSRRMVGYLARDGIPDSRDRV